MFVGPIFTCLKLQQQNTASHPLLDTNTVPKAGENGLIPIEYCLQGSVIISKGMQCCCSSARPYRKQATFFCTITQNTCIDSNVGLLFICLK